MNLQHRNQAPRPQNRHRFDFERKSLKKPEAPGSAGRCEKGTGRSTAPPLCPAPFSHPFRCPYPGLFQPWPYGAEFGFCGLGTGRFPTLGRKPPHRATQGPTGGFPFWAAAGHKKDRRRGLPGGGFGVTIVYAGNLPILLHPPARRGISAAGSPPAPWRCPIPIGWR